MPSKKRTVTIEILADSDKARRDLDRIADSTTKTGKSFSSMATLVKTGLAAFGAREMLQALVKLDQLNVQMQANEERADVVFGHMADDARTWADEQNEAFGIGENALLGLASNMQDLLVPMGFARDEAFGLTQDALTLSNALDDWKGGTLGVENATTRIIKSMLGEREGLVELGIKISDADVKTRLLEKGQQDLTGASLAQATATATLELITEKSADAMEKYADRTDSAVAANKELSATTADATEKVAKGFGPSIEVGKGLLIDIVNALDAAVAKVDELDVALGGGAEAIDEVSTAAQQARDVGLSAMHRGLTDAKRAADDATTALSLTADEMQALVDPAFNLTQQQGKLNEAFAAYHEAAQTHGADSQEARDAAFALVEQQLRMKAAQEAFNDLGPESHDAFVLLATDLGIAAGQAEDLWRFLRGIGQSSVPNIPRGSGRGPSFGGGLQVRHEGGMVAGTPGSDQLIIAQAGEHVTRRASVNGGGDGAITVNLVVDGRVLATEVVLPELLRRQRRNGSSGLI